MSEQKTLNKKIVHATKWSGITEVVSKLVTPISSMVLARLLTPEAFGVVTTLAMIITFAELFTDAGFQKYLIQHDFKDDIDREQSATVAFWSNFIFSMVIWGIIAIFADSLAALVGNPGLGNVLIIACVSIPLAAFSSIQMALFKRDLDFRTLFKVRMVGISTPIIITIPLAIWLRSYWALVIGTIAHNVVNAFFLTWFSKWKPKMFYSFAKLKEMFSFTFWTLLEAISIWLTHYVDVFIVGTMLSQHYLGLYKTSSTLVGQIMGIITAATTPVLFSSLSKLQNNDAEFRRLFFRFQKIVGLLIVPLGVGIFCFSDLVTELILGDQWMEASGFIGLWGLTNSVTIIFAHYSSEVYRAKGRPKLSMLAQILHIIFLWPTVLIAVNYGFETLYISRSLIRFQLVAVHMVLMYLVVKISPWQMLSNVSVSLFASFVMIGVAMLMLTFSQSILWQVLAICICAIVYAIVVMLFPMERNMLYSFILRRHINENTSSW